MKLVYYGDPILREQATEIVGFTRSLQIVADRMKIVMHKKGGVGLSAPQVGLLQRLIVLKFPPNAMANPRIIDRSKETTRAEEGCLSIPGVFAHIDRHDIVVVEFEDLRGNTRSVKFNGREARVLQHEIDHLDGRLFVDHLPLPYRLALKPRLNAIARNHPASEVASC